MFQGCRPSFNCSYSPSFNHDACGLSFMKFLIPRWLPYSNHFMKIHPVSITHKLLFLLRITTHLIIILLFLPLIIFIFR